MGYNCVLSRSDYHGCKGKKGSDIVYSVPGATWENKSKYTWKKLVLLMVLISIGNII